MGRALPVLMRTSLAMADMVEVSVGCCEWLEWSCWFRVISGGKCVVQFVYSICLRVKASCPLQQSRLPRHGSKIHNALSLAIPRPTSLLSTRRTHAHTHTHPYYDEFTNQRPRPGASLHEQTSALTIHRKLKHSTRLRRSQDTLWRETTYTFFCHALHPFSTWSWKLISAFVVRVRECKPFYGTFLFSLRNKRFASDLSRRHSSANTQFIQ